MCIPGVPSPPILLQLIWRLNPIPRLIFEYVALQETIFDCGVILEQLSDYCCVDVYLFGMNNFEFPQRCADWPRVGVLWEMMVD